MYNLLGNHAGTVFREVRYLPFFLSSLVSINIYLAIFNLIPVPPLDGSKVLLGVLPRRYHESIYALESYGPIILMLLIITNMTGRILLPIARVMIYYIDVITYTIVAAF